MDLLLQRGADPRAPGPNGGSLLHSAAAGGLEALERRLLDQGAPPGERDRYGLTPLHYAAAYGRSEIVSLLLARGGSLDAKDPGGRTPLSLAHLYGHEATASLIASRGAAASDATVEGRDDAYLGERRPGTEPLLFAPGIVSTFEWEHGSPSFSPDGREILWTSCLHTTSYCSVFHVTRERGGWSAPRPAPFSSSYGEAYPRFSPDGSTIFFNSYRPVEPGGPGGPQASRLWMTSRTGTGWSPPVPVRFPSGGHVAASSASLTNSGRLYFSMAREDGAGGFDIYVSQLAGGRFGEPQLVGAPISTRDDESIPYVSPDERYMIFSSGDRPENAGSYNLYVSFRGKDGRWSPPRHMEAPITGRGLNWLPSVSADGRYLFFSSDRNGNIGDVYWVDARVIEALRR